jgi:hypothetical protein
MKKTKKFQLHDKSQWKNATARKHGQRFLLHQRGIISKTEIENSPSKRESGKKSTASRYGRLLVRKLQLS